MTLRTLVAAGLAAVWLAGPAPADTLAVTGTVTDPAGNPAAGAEVASFWTAVGDAMTAHKPAAADADGKFALKVESFGQPLAVLAFSKDRKHGGLAAVTNESAGKGVAVKLEPAVRVRADLFCKELDFKPEWANAYVMTPDGARVLQCSSRKAGFSFLLPAGPYKFWAYGTDIRDHRRDLALSAGEPVLDLGTIEVRATPIAKHKGKAPPRWTVTDARGAKKDVTLADYKGKWVLVDFYTHWCGPCVQRSLPDLMELYDLHKDHRDKFEVLAFHVKYAKDFKDYDAKMAKAVKDVWHGKDLPFPVLLDATDETIKAFGIRSFPTTVLIDPAGNLVGEADEGDLEAKLPPVPAAVRVPRALDKNLSFGVDGLTVKGAADLLAAQARVPIRLDEPALKAAGVSPGDKVPLTLSGMVTLRSWLNLALDPVGLTYKADDTGLLVTAKDPKAPPAEPSGPQKGCAARIEGRLGEPRDFDFKGATLAEVAAHFERATTENFVLDPAARRKGTLDPGAKVTGAAKGVPLRDGLRQLLDPLGLAAVVRDEVVVIAPKAGS